MSADDEKRVERIELPEEVLEALKWSAVGGINALRRSRGLQLYDAKQAIDAYLDQHPEHPQALRSKQQPQVQSPLKPEPLFVELTPVAGLPISLESLPNQSAAPLAYLVAQAELSDRGHWFGALLRICQIPLRDSSVQILDEVRRNEDFDIASVVVKIVGPADGNGLKDLSHALRQSLPQEIKWRLVLGCRREDAAIPLDEIEVQYFLQEFSYRSYMVSSTTNCVRLKHLPTGVTCRSTAHRSRARNYEEALLLLASLVNEAK